MSIPTPPTPPATPAGSSAATAAESSAAAPAYPAHWEADVVLADGGTAHVRPIQPADADRLVALHARLSPESIRYRYFAPHPTLSAKEVERFTHVDHDQRVALVAVLGDEIVAVGRYDRVPGADVAEVAFVVDDEHQGRGLGSVLLEHLAAVAGERGIRRFEADVLADNMRMARVFVDAGYQASREYEEGTVHLVFPIEPTTASLAVMRSREHRAEARSIGRLLTPRSVAVVGAGRSPDSLGHQVLVNLIGSGFQGPVYPVNPEARHVASVRAYPSLSEIPDEVDLAVLAVAAPDVPAVLAECARRGVRGLVVLSGGFGESGPGGRDAERALVATARANGMRVIGPNCMGVLNTAAEISLNATLAPTMPARGKAGFFCQSWTIGVAILESIARRGLGLSTFVSAGNRADVSGNDLLQYWEDDPATDAVLLHIESFGNPRKFARLARRLGRRKPIVAVKSGGPVAARLAGAAEPERAADALFRQAGVIRVDTLAQLFDVAQMLTTQPLPGGHRVAVVGNAPELGRLAADSCTGNGLEVAPLSPATAQRLRAALGPGAVVDNPLALDREIGPDELDTALGAVLADPAVNAVLAVLSPPLDAADPRVVQALSPRTGPDAKPLVCTLVGFGGLAARMHLRAGEVPRPEAVPSFRSPERAAAALAQVATYAQWRRRPEGEVPLLADVDRDAARAVVTEALATAPQGGPLADEQADRLLAAYGVRVWPVYPVGSADQAAAAATRVGGYPVALKATAEKLRHRLDLGTVRLDIASEEELRSAYEARAARLGPEAGLAVQAMARPGVATVIRTVEDPAFGALISFGIGGIATDLLGDHAFRVLPLTDVDAADLVRGPRAAPLLSGYRGSEPVDLAALEQLLLRVAQLADDLPEVAELELNPVIVAPSGLAVLSASVRVGPPAARLDAGPRRLR
jgi:acyl-CoA synthetase (NDP forming)/GNAT superfamily N-acetyltransferase